MMLARVTLLAGAAILFAMLALTCLDVFGRYILNAPVNGKTELTRLMMGAMIFCALPVVTVTGEQITVDLLDRFFGRRSAYVRDCLVDLLGATCLLVMVHWLAFRSDRLYSRNYVTDFLHLPLYPIAYFITFMTLVAGLALLLKLFIDIAYAVHPPLSRRKDMRDSNI